MTSAGRVRARRSLCWLLVAVFAAAIAAEAQRPRVNYPSRIPLPPGTDPADRRGSPRQQRRVETQEIPNLVSEEGLITHSDSKQLVIQADDKRVITIKLTTETHFLDEGALIKAGDLHTGDRVQVLADQDEKGGLTAMRVERLARANPAPAAGEPPAEAARKPDQPEQKEAKPDSAPATPGLEIIRTPSETPPPEALADDEGPPKLEHGAPSSRPRKPAVASKAPTPATLPAAGPKPKAAPLPPDPHEALLERARRSTVEFTGKLPNYYCTEFIARYRSNSRPANWDAQDVLSATVVYEDGEESYRAIKVNGKPSNKGFRESGGAWSTGEFGTILFNLMEPATDATFRFRGSSEAAGRAAEVFDFEVKQPRSHFRVQSPSQSFITAYRGALWIDKQTARALRIEIQAVRIPEAFPFDHVETTVDYAFVAIGAGRYLLPARAENLLCQRGTTLCLRNVMDFRNYKRWEAQSEVTFEK